VRSVNVLDHYFLRSCDRASCQILTIKPTRFTNFSNLFWKETPHVSDNSSVHCQEFFTVHTATVYVIQVCRQLSSRIRIKLLSSVYKPEWHIPLLCAQLKTRDDGQELSVTRRLSFQNKFGKSVHLTGFIVRKVLDLDVWKLYSTKYELLQWTPTDVTRGKM
jgi:hypothetical protein